MNWKSWSTSFLTMLVVCAVTTAQPAKQQPSESLTIDGQTYELKWADDFENGDGNWKSTDDANWELKAEEKNHAFGIKKRKSDYQPKYRSPHNIALIKDKSFSDFVLEFRVKSTKDTGHHRDCCVFFGYQNPEQFYYVHLGAKPDPASGQIMIVDKAARKPLTKNERGVPWTSDWHNVRLKRDVSVGTITIYFDDLKEPLMTVKDKTFANGQIGIGSFDDMNDFDDVRLFVPKS